VVSRVSTLITLFSGILKLSTQKKSGSKINNFVKEIKEYLRIFWKINVFD